MIKCVALDIDDTLIRTTRARVEARRRLAEYMEEKVSLTFLEGNILPTLEAVVNYFGLGSEQELLHALCFEGGKRGEELEQMARMASEYYRSQFFSFLKPFPQCETLLQDLTVREMTLGIISNGLEEFQKAKLAATGLNHYFPILDRVLISSSFGPAGDKPNQVMYRHFIEKSGCSPQEVLFVGDKLSDIVGANLAGMVNAWVLQGKAEKYLNEEFKPRLQIEKADYVIQEIGELLDIL